MRIKNLLALSLVSVLSTGSTIANAYQGEFNFLLGVQGGAESRKGEFATRYTTVAPLALLAPAPNVAYHGAQESVTDSGVILGALGGIQWQCERLVLGLELSADFQSFEKNRPLVFANEAGGPGALYSGTVEYDRGPQLSLDARIGWFVTPFFMPYIKVGGSWSKDDFSYVVSQIVPTVVAAPDLSNSLDHEVWGWHAGLGVEFPAFGPTTVRAEAVYARTDDVVINDAVAPVIGTHKYQSPRAYIGRVAWVWNFNKI